MSFFTRGLLIGVEIFGAAASFTVCAVVVIGALAFIVGLIGGPDDEE